MRLFGTSGMRFIADSWLLEQALKVGLATGSKYHRVVIGTDTRTSSPAIKNAVLAGLSMSGTHPYDAGIVPTPTLALAASKFDAGVMITASHNPPEYNGIKLLNYDGSAFDLEQRSEIEEIVLHNTFGSAPWADLTGPQQYPDAAEQHIEKIIEILPGKCPIRVVIDCGGGSACRVTPELLEKMGCEVIRLNCYPAGDFPRGSEPVEENLSGLISQVRQERADIGLAHDGDADRVMAVDETGRFVSGDRLMVILAESLKAKEVVTSIDASMLVDERSFKVTRTPVGDNNISMHLKQEGDFGAEPSGHWFFPAVSLCPDGVFAAAMLASIASRNKISDLAGNLPEYPIFRRSLEMDKNLVPVIIEELSSKGFESRDTRDGLKLIFPDGWVLVRPSGTEPGIRVTAEARSSERAQELFDIVFQSVEAVSKGAKP